MTIFFSRKSEPNTMRSNLFIQRQKLKQSTVWETFFVGLFVRHSSKKSASPHPFSVNNCMCQCDRVVLDLLTFYSFCKSFSFAFFFFWECPNFLSHISQFTMMCFEHFCSSQVKTSFLSPIDQWVQKKEFLPKTESRCANRYCKNDVT